MPHLCLECALSNDHHPYKDSAFVGGVSTEGFNTENGHVDGFTGPSEAVIEWSGQRGCEAAEYNLPRIARNFFAPLRSRRALVASLTSGMKF